MSSMMICSLRDLGSVYLDILMSFLFLTAPSFFSCLTSRVDPCVQIRGALWSCHAPRPFKSPQKSFLCLKSSAVTLKKCLQHLSYQV